MEELVEDGFGTAASAVCSICGIRAVFVCRPGDIRCGVCEGNPKEWYQGEECQRCYMKAVYNGKCSCCGLNETRSN